MYIWCQLIDSVWVNPKFQEFSPGEGYHVVDREDARVIFQIGKSLKRQRNGLPHKSNWIGDPSVDGPDL